MDASHDDDRDDRRRSTSRDSRTARIELAQRRLENALATPNSPSSPWSARSALAPTLGLAVGSPTHAGHSPNQFSRPSLRSVSFSSEPDHRFPARRTDQPAFPSTFEDNESELSLEDAYFYPSERRSSPTVHPTPRRSSPSALLSGGGGGGRAGLYASIGANGLPVPSPDLGTRSRSQSLATLGRRPMPPASAYSHTASHGHGHAPASPYAHTPSSPLPAPGTQGLPQSWADSRFGIPAPISYARPGPAPPRQGDISNISPFVRDVGQILHDDFRELWDDVGGVGIGGGVGGGGSGTTSRRHSVSVVQPRRFVSHVHMEDRGGAGGGLDAFTQGRSVIADEELLGNMLNLDLDDPPAHTHSSSGGGGAARVVPATFNPRGPLGAASAAAGLASQPSSLPTYPAPLQRHSPVGALGLHEHSPRGSPFENGNGSAFRQAQNQTQNRDQNPSPERDRGFVSRPSLTQLRTDSLRSTGSGGNGGAFSPSLSPGTQRAFHSHAQAFGQGQGVGVGGQERGVTGLGLGLGLGGGREQGGFGREQGVGYGRDQGQGGFGREQTAGFGREREQNAGFGRDTGFGGQGQGQAFHPSASPRTSTFPSSPTTMRSGFGPAHGHIPQTPLSPSGHHNIGGGSGNTNAPNNEGDLGRGLPLSSVPPGAPLYVVEFKAGRTDLFFTPEGGIEGSSEPIRRGDLVIVEADRGKDLGKVVNDSISLAEVERFMMEGADDGQGGRKEIMPKRIYGRAGPGDTQ